MSETAWTELETESVSLLSALLQVDTSNPPGNETACAQVVATYLRRSGVESEMAGVLPLRQNLVARLAGRRPGPVLLLLAHSDVVPADAAEWRVPPFSGLVRDGYVWGRGALDMKCQLAAGAVAVARAARAGADFAGELVLCVTADEERGEHCGARWLVDERPEMVRCDYLVNEGGGTYVNVGGRRLYTCTVGEKAYAQFRIRTRGRGGHGSVPLHRHNAVELLGRVIAALGDHRLPARIPPLTAGYIDRLVPQSGLARRLKDPSRARDAVAHMLAIGDERAYLIEPLLGITFSPTILRAGGEAANVIPSHAEATFDCRILPGQTTEDVRREVQRALAPLGDSWALEWIDMTEGNESPFPTPLSDGIERALGDLVAEADVVPSYLCGFTDSRWFRERFPEVVAYGFCPFNAEDAVAMGGREHAQDERIAVADMPFQSLFFERLIAQVLR